jgi:hypothetical protein
MVRRFKSEDEGMTVRTASGDEIGKIEGVHGDIAHVTPDSSLTESIRKRLGWSDENENMYELKHSSVARFEDDEVHLKP